jgi:hypothetical protein
MTMSGDAAVDILQTADIGGTNASTPWVSMASFEKIYAKVILGTWNASDDLDECRLQQGQGSGGSNPKDLTTDASGGDYDTDNPIDALGNTVVLEALAEDLDVDGGYDHVRLYVAEGGNSGVDNITGVLVRYDARQKHEHLEAAPIVGEVVYVHPA